MGFGPSIKEDFKSAPFLETDWDRPGSLWAHPGLRHQGGGRAANRVHGPDLSRNTHEEPGTKKQNEGSG